MPVVNKARKPDYRDLDLDFSPHPATGDVPFKVGEEAIKRSIRNLILTNFYDRPFRSSIGSNAQKLLFENIDKMTAANLERACRDVIINFEPRVTLIDIVVSVTPDWNAYIVGLKYTINNRLEPTVSTIILERIR